MYHYVYRLDHLETNEFYIGSRTSKVHPSLDNYLGSMCTWKPGKIKLKKIILKDDFAHRDEAMQYEADEISKVINEELNRNYHIPNKGYHTAGQVTVIDKDGKTFNVSVDDPRYLSGELNGITIGFTNLKDSEGNIYHVAKNDHRYLSGELTGITKGKVTVKDKEGKCFIVLKTDPLYLSGELVPTWLGKKHSTETIKNVKKTFKRIEHQQGQKNSQWGTCWIHKLDENKKIKKEELDNYISLGWNKGRVCNELRNKKCINKDSLIKYINENEIDLYLKEGWSLVKK